MLCRISFAFVALAMLQPASPADLAAQMTGKWRLNPALSDQGRGPARGGGPAYSRTAASYQRGARGGGAGNVPEPMPEPSRVTAAEAAAQQALAIVQQAQPEMTIAATAAQITVQDPRGDSVFQIDGKNKTVDVPGGSIKVKSRWDRATLRQEFSSTQRVLHRTWSVDATGRLLTLKQRLEGIGLKGRETQAVYDRQ